MGKKIKHKPSKAVLKRVKVTAKGKIKRHRPGKRHLQSSKTAARRRHLRRTDIVVGGDENRILRMLGMR